MGRSTTVQIRQTQTMCVTILTQDICIECLFSAFSYTVFRDFPDEPTSNVIPHPVWRILKLTGQRVTRGTSAYTPLEAFHESISEIREVVAKYVERLSGHFGFPMSLDSNVMDFMRDLKPMRAYTYVLPPIACWLIPGSGSLFRYFVCQAKGILHTITPPLDETNRNFMTCRAFRVTSISFPRTYGVVRPDVCNMFH